MSGSIAIEAPDERRAAELGELVEFDAELIPAEQGHWEIAVMRDRDLDPVDRGRVGGRRSLAHRLRLALDEDRGRRSHLSAKSARSAAGLALVCRSWRNLPADAAQIGVARAGRRSVFAESGSAQAPSRAPHDCAQRRDP